ncbi:MAG TPA: AmmeMemoRadiSam system protein A [Candidatus Cloacimonadota bacterium]|nr:AmmeMemoRadiSam system protein A [Candidatus Cloacimonadota bacterium]
MLSDKMRSELLAFARAVITRKLQGTPCHTPSDEVYSELRGVFVSIHKHGELRGCIGYIRGFKNIVDSVREMALSAAFRDPRFSPLQADELPEIRLEISILSPMIPVEDIADITIGRDGLYLEHPYSSGLLLPQVATEWGWDRDTFLAQLCRKASLPNKAWMDKGARLYRFSAEIFGEE